MKNCRKIINFKILYKYKRNDTILKKKKKGEKFMYKLVAIDLDGTLLNSYGEVSIQNKKAIQNAMEKNVEVVLASGRPIMSVKNLANEIGCNHYMICGNGSITYDMQKERILYNRFLEKAKVLQIIKICEENSIFYNVYTKDTILTKNLNYNILFYHQENASKPEEKKTSITMVENIVEYIENREEEDYLKITICDNDKIIFGSIIRKLNKIKGVDVLEVEHMARKMIKDGTKRVYLEYYYTEITNTNVNKWEAIQDLIGKLQIKKEEVMAIGDNINDAKMIQEAGLGVILENAAPYIQSIADVIAKDNDNDGVAEVIQKYILNE